MNVVVAAQAPALFNILARSSCWHMRTLELGDHAGLSEMAESTVPQWAEDVDEAPDAVIVCSPRQFENASAKWPKAKILWAIHNGYERWLMPPEHDGQVSAAICFSERVRWLQQFGRGVRHYFVSPAYEAAPVWEWSPHAPLWTLRNRPKGRGDDVELTLPAIVDGFNHVLYGQDQKRGVADAERKASLYRKSAAYVSPVQRTAGFGLAEHEAMAAGVPLIGDSWGDLAEELSPDYWGMRNDLHMMRPAIRMVLRDGSAARELSRLGLEYIQKYRSMERMNDTVATMLKAVG